MLAVTVDAAVTAIGGYLLFLLAELLAPCGSQGTCPALAPLAVLLLALLLVVYFGGGYLLWKRTPGERIFRP